MRLTIAYNLGTHNEYHVDGTYNRILVEVLLIYMISTSWMMLLVCMMRVMLSLLCLLEVLNRLMMVVWVEINW